MVDRWRRWDWLMLVLATSLTIRPDLPLVAVILVLLALLGAALAELVSKRGTQ